MLTSLRSTPSAIILTSIRRRLCAHPPCDSVDLKPRLSIDDLLLVLPLRGKPSDFYRSQDAILPSMLTRCSGRTLLNRMAARPGAMLDRRAANTFEGYMGCESGLARGACRELLRHSICSTIRCHGHFSWNFFCGQSLDISSTRPIGTKYSSIGFSRYYQPGVVRQARPDSVYPSVCLFVPDLYLTL